MTEYLSLAVSEQDFNRPQFSIWLRDLVARTRTENEQRWRAANQLHKEMIAQLVELYGANNKEVRYFKNKGVPLPPNLARQQKQILKRYQAFCDEQQRKARREANRLKREAKRQAEEIAHEQLRAHRRPLEREQRYRSRASDDELQLAGFVRDVDYLPTCAISFARRIVWQAELEERESEPNEVQP